MTELRYFRISKCLKDLVKSDVRDAIFKARSFQWAASLILRKQNILTISLDKVEPFTITYKGNTFNTDILNYTSIFSVYKDYPFDKISKEDIVLDLGANIGAFSIPASRLCKKVYSVEPIFADTIKDNIKLNNISNIEVLELGVGKEGKESFEFMGVTRTIDSLPFKSIKSNIGKIDYLKIDIEGNEWTIEPEDFIDIRVITGEGHIFTKREKRLCNWSKWKSWFESNNYKLEFKKVRDISYEFTAIRA